jgi:hypothetical protein
MSVRRRLALGFAITLIVLGIQIGATARWRYHLSSLHARASGLLAPRLEAARALEGSALSAQVALQAYAASRAAVDLARYRRAQVRARGALERLAAVPAGVEVSRALGLLPPPGDLPRAVERDELGELGAAFGRIAARLRDREQRAAASQRLSALLAASLEVPPLARGALVEMLAYRGAEVGAVYVREDDGELLRRVAAIGLDEAPWGLRAEQGIPGEALAAGRGVVIRERARGDGADDGARDAARAQR